jgi:hypothetical protein
MIEVERQEEGRGKGQGLKLEKGRKDGAGEFDQLR